MSIDEHKRVVAGLVDQVWNQYDATAIDRYFGPGLWEEVAEHYQQLLRGFPDLQVTIEDDLIAEGDRVVALGLLQQLGAVPEIQPVIWAGSSQRSSPK
jgi:predicted ester cyclase